MRVYVPLTLSGLAEAYKTGELGAGPFVAYAVTPALREWYLSDDIEELEYAALNRAALASLRLLAVDPGAVRRRVVVAVDVPDRAAVADPDRGLDPAALGEVRVSGAVALAKAAAVHVDVGRRRGGCDRGRGGAGGGRSRGRRRAVRRGRGRGPRAAVVRHAGDSRTWWGWATEGRAARSQLLRARADALWSVVSVGGYFLGMGKHGAAHIVWDWNGTLFHDNDAIIGATNAAFAELGLEPITLERYRALYCVPVPKFYERLMGRLPTDAEWQVMDETFHRYYAEHRIGVRAHRGGGRAARRVGGRRGAASRS